MWMLRWPRSGAVRSERPDLSACAGGLDPPAVRRQQSLRNRPRRARADGRSVEGDDRREFLEAAGDEQLVGGLKIRRGQDALPVRDPLGGGDLQGQLASNAREQPAGQRRGQEPAILHDEDIRARTLGHLAPGIEKDRLQRAFRVGLPGRERVVEKVRRLDRGVERLDRIPPYGRDDRGAAFGVERVVCGFQRLDVHRDRGLGDALEAIRHVPHAAAHDHAKVRFRIVGELKTSVDLRPDLHVFGGEIEAEPSDGPAQPSQVAVELERPSPIRPQRFIRAVAEDETVVRDLEGDILGRADPSPD